MYFYVTILRQVLEAMLQNNRKSKTGKKKIKDQDNKNIGKQSREASDDGNGKPTVILSISIADLRNNPPQVEQHRGLKKCACVCVCARAHTLGGGE